MSFPCAEILIYSHLFCIGYIAHILHPLCPLIHRLLKVGLCSLCFKFRLVLSLLPSPTVERFIQLWLWGENIRAAGIERIIINYYIGAWALNQKPLWVLSPLLHLHQTSNHFIFFRMDLYSIDMEMVQCYGSFQIMILLLVILADFSGVWVVGLLSIQLKQEWNVIQDLRRQWFNVTLRNALILQSAK